MAATTLGFIPLQLIPTSALGQYQLDKGFASNGTYVVVKTPTVAQQLQLTKSLKEMQNGGKEINNNENANSKPVLLRCKRRVDFAGMGCKIVDPQNPSVSRRNERERKRVKMVNMGFETLRQHVPVGRKNKKMSKVETLRSAVQYIKQLQDMLDGSEGNLENLLPDNMDMDALEDKVSEMIKNVNDSNNNSSNSENSANNNYNNGLEMALNNNSDLSTSADVVNTIDTTCNSKNMCEELGARLQQTTMSQQQMQQQTMSPQSSPDVPCSPEELDTHQQQHFFPAFQSHPVGGYVTSQYDTISSAGSMTSALAYSQASPEGSLHSPTSSVVSDSSYESMGHDDDDYLQSLSNWFQ